MICDREVLGERRAKAILVRTDRRLKQCASVCILVEPAYQYSAKVQRRIIDPALLSSGPNGRENDTSRLKPRPARSRLPAPRHMAQRLSKLATQAAVSLGHKK